ncbi:MAG: hypothetical protein M3Z18_07785 [Gemmatimonadota bacterium]|nr:hypothetical protein [Gemmatimonadota bacterium]
MTIAIVLKIGDGLVIGADSASTFADATGVSNVYFNAEKVFNLVKGLPLGAVVAGLGGLQGRSVATLAKDLRARMADPKNTDWFLDPTTYTVEDAVKRIRTFFYDELYVPETKDWQAPSKPTMSLLVGGYSAGQARSEVWSVEIAADGTCKESCDFPKEGAGGAVWRGLPEALNRLLRGYSSTVYDQLVASGVPTQSATAFLAGIPVMPLIHEAMPIQDAIDLLHYLIDVTAGFVRFAPGAPVVHPPTDSAAITAHEGFRWIQRKHYFNRRLNRPIDRYNAPLGER